MIVNAAIANPDGENSLKFLEIDVVIFDKFSLGETIYFWRKIVLELFEYFSDQKHPLEGIQDRFWICYTVLIVVQNLISEVKRLILPIQLFIPLVVPSIHDILFVCICRRIFNENWINGVNRSLVLMLCSSVLDLNEL